MACGPWLADQDAERAHRFENRGLDLKAEHQQYLIAGFLSTVLEEGSKKASKLDTVSKSTP